MKQLITILLQVFLILSSPCFIAAQKAPVTDEQIQPLITTSELVVGTNRFAFGLTKAGKLVENANVQLGVYDLGHGQLKLASKLNVPYQPVRNVKHELTVHRHAHGSLHVHNNDSGVRGLYVTHLQFSRAGEWGIELIARQANEPPEIIRFSVAVLNASATPAVGSAAPRSHNLVASDVTDLREIDTSTQPDPRLHQIRIADAIAQRKPQLIVFATPQFCTSRMCGPVVEIVRTLLPAYGQRVAFTHQEIWKDFAAKQMFSTVEEWRLDTEPWIFVVDSNGIIKSKFEGLVTAHELQSALDRILPK